MQEAISIVSQQGFHSLTMANIAGKVGVSESALYRHFNSKNDLLMEILNDLFLRTAGNISAVTSQPVSSTEKLMRIMEIQLTMFHQQPALANMLFAEDYFYSNHALKMLIHSIINTIQLYIQEIIENGKRTEEFISITDPYQMSLMYLGSMRMVVMEWKLSNYRKNLVDEGKALLENMTALITQKNFNN